MRKRRKKESIRQRKRRKNRLKMVCSVIFSLLFIAALAALIIWKVFVVKEVVVKGNKHYSKEQIEKFVLSDEHSWNSLYVALKYRFLNVEELPFVDSMEVSLRNPQTLEVSVYEKGILGYLYISAINQYAYFDKDGFVVETSRDIIEDVPQVEGLECDKVVLYEKLPLKDNELLRGLLTATLALKKHEIVPQKVQFDDFGKISLIYGGIEVLLGDTDSLSQKILRLPYILPEISGKTGILHVENWTENTKDIIFEERK